METDPMTPEELEAIRARRWDMRPSITPLNDRGVLALLDREALLEEVDRLRAALVTSERHAAALQRQLEEILVRNEERVIAQIRGASRTKRVPQ